MCFCTFFHSLILFYLCIYTFVFSKTHLRNIATFLDTINGAVNNKVYTRYNTICIIFKWIWWFMGALWKMFIIMVFIILNDFFVQSHSFFLFVFVLNKNGNSLGCWDGSLDGVVFFDIRMIRNKNKKQQPIRRHSKMFFW